VENFVDYYLSKFSKEQVTTIWKKLGKEVAINEKVQTLRSVLYVAGKLKRKTIIIVQKSN
jgi:hypothetical protein